MCLLLLIHNSIASLQAGISRVDGTAPIGTPLAGYNYFPRATEIWPIPDPKTYSTFMQGSVGVYNPTWVKALVLDDGNERVAFVTMDVVGSDGPTMALAYSLAYEMGFSVPFEKCMFSASHTHSGPGAISSDFLWSIAPATDLMVPSVQRKFAQAVANALVEAEKNLQPAKLDVGSSILRGVTHNRRTDVSPYVNYTSIDPNLGVVRVDTADGKPLAIIWNYAIHGICYDAPNLNFSSDVMGSVCEYVQSQTGALTFFWNADAGDVNPIFSVCCNNGPNFSGGPVIGEAVIKNWENLNPSSQVTLESFSNVVDFGLTHLNLTLARVDNCTRGGPLDICSFCKIMNCDADIQLPSSWIDHFPRFSAYRISVNNRNNIVVSIPGEALIELGFDIRADLAALKFDLALLAGYSNNHLGYFAPPREYVVGGYESLLTFWGIGTSTMIRNGCRAAAKAVVP